MFTVQVFVRACLLRPQFCWSNHNDMMVHSRLNKLQFRSVEGPAFLMTVGSSSASLLGQQHHCNKISPGEKRKYCS